MARLPTLVQRCRHRLPQLAAPTGPASVWVRLAKRRWEACHCLSIYTQHGLGLSGVTPLSFWARTETQSLIIRPVLALGTTELDLLCMKVCEFTRGFILELAL